MKYYVEHNCFLLSSILTFYSNHHFELFSPYKISHKDSTSVKYLMLCFDIPLFTDINMNTYTFSMLPFINLMKSDKKWNYMT